MAADPIGTLRSFRVGLYRCFTGWADTLFELCDAVVCSPASVHSVPSLSLEPVFRRGHGSLYKALDRGGIDTDQLRRLLVTHLPEPGVGPRVFAVDASTWDRCDAETSPERGFYYSASKHSAGQPIVAGWNYQWINQLCFTPDSWTAPADVTRIAPADTHTDATVAQIRQLFTFLPDEQHAPMFVFDAGYDPIAIGHDLADINARSCAASATTASSTPLHHHTRTGPQPPAAARHATAPACPAPTLALGHHRQRHSTRTTSATARSASTPGQNYTHDSAAAVTGSTTPPHQS